MAKYAAYPVAKKKIEAARGSEAKELDLGGMGLTQLPESLGQLKQLQKLNLSNNRLTVLPEWLGQLTQLQTLNLSSNRLSALPESLSQLTQLETLRLGVNELMQFDDSANRVKPLPQWLGSLKNLRTLDLCGNRLGTIPEWLGQLTRLQHLDLENNDLTELPDSLSRLQELKHLSLLNNQLSSLPDALVNLKRLTVLNLFRNRFRQIPDWICRLESLQSLGIGANQIESLPESTRKCESLRDLNLGDFGGGIPIKVIPESIRALKTLQKLLVNSCQLSALPDWLGELSEIRTLYLADNELKDLPPSLAKLRHLSDLKLEGNPLNPNLAAAHKEGLDAVKRYLREMAKGTKKRYEAKLLILGDGNEGKTCVSRALRGLPFRVQKTTRGVDVVQWKFPHPAHSADREKDITLNIWDFEGQEISHQTHQFFLASQSLYLLVFKCRDQFLLDRAEYWLDTIRARAPRAKVAIVISQCEGRMPLVPLDRIQAQYSDILAKEWFFSVGCEDGSNIPKLQAFLQRWASEVEFMGSPWPLSYEKAETELKAKAKKSTARISRDKLHSAFHKAGVSQDGYEDAAAAMARLGVITQFPDCPDLRDFVVLRPQWLTKAISKVMEDTQLSTDQGQFPLQRMAVLWKKDYPGMFATFHDCMKEFELCYDLENNARSCLVPLRFGYLRPAILWSDIAGMKVRRVEYKLNIRPPTGIMSRFIVKTHHMIVRTAEQPKGVYWHNGVFLRNGEGPLASEALCEFVPEERKLCIEVRAAYPQNLCEQIHAYIEAVFSFFSGLSAERSYGCIRLDNTMGNESQCRGFHTEKRIYTAISRQRRMLDCEFEDHEVDPRLLVSGISSFGGFVEERLRAVVREEVRTGVKTSTPEWAEPFMLGVGSLVEWVQQNGSNLDQLLTGQAALSAAFKQEAELKLHQYLALMNQMLDDRNFTAAPGLIAVRTKDRSAWNPAGYFKQTYVLVPYCECQGKPHACEDGLIEFTKDKAWWHATAPWIVRSTKLLTAGLQLAFAGLPLALGSDVAKAVEDEVKFMEELTEHMELKVPDQQKEAETKSLDDAAFGTDLRGMDLEASLSRAALARFLKETAPDNYEAKRWGSLRRVWLKSNNTHRWLCTDCAKQARY